MQSPFKIPRNEAQWKCECRQQDDKAKFYHAAVSHALTDFLEWYDNDLLDNLLDYDTEALGQFAIYAIQELKESEMDYSLWYTQVLEENF